MAVVTELLGRPALHEYANKANKLISAVWISVPSIFYILKFLLIQVYLRSGTLIGLLLWLYSFPFVIRGMSGNRGYTFSFFFNLIEKNSFTVKKNF